MRLATPFKNIIFLIIPLVLLGCEAENEQAQAPIQTPHVDTLTLSPITLRLSNELPGRITAYKEAEVRPQVSGIVKSREFIEGGEVSKGDILYKIDATVYQATVNSAEAQLAKALASLQSAKKELDRYELLLQKKLASQQLYDEANTVYLEAKAEVAIRQADLDYASIQLSYTDIKAPISGQIRSSEINEGALVTAEQSSLLTTIIQIDQVYIEMQQSAVSLYKLRQEFAGTDNGDKTEKIMVPVTVSLEDGTEYGETGYLEFADLEVNDSTGSVTLRALIENPKHALLPGSFVRANISQPKAKDYLIIPQSAVVRSQSGAPSVFIVNANGITEKKTITIGREVDNSWVVTDGLNSGDQLVINNLSNMKNEIEVIVDSTSETQATDAELKQ
ncbi:efflux RND transporter periplasmic adaptor subunit [Psychromonas sp. KJ10-10]|uniref:efflux RND transporter periplasmic adaptor subunit n=1 Tax=Psychromonas sp. KJ10-10 TaxID=3391823 RepID=UPI0039B68016